MSRLITFVASVRYFRSPGRLNICAAARRQRLSRCYECPVSVSRDSASPKAGELAFRKSRRGEEAEMNTFGHSFPLPV